MGWEVSPRDKATELYELYKNSTPEIQSAVELLLKSAQQTPGQSHQTDKKDQ